jgi:hypothetical protein
LFAKNKNQHQTTKKASTWGESGLLKYIIHLGALSTTTKRRSNPNAHQ